MAIGNPSWGEEYVDMRHSLLPGEMPKALAQYRGSTIV